jgi:drug/metabolite transporter (DMT)-like permease
MFGMSSLTHAPALAIGLAVVASFGFAAAAVLQHRAVAARSGNCVDDTPGDTLSLRGMRDVSKRPGWLLGLGLAAGGSTIHAMALVLAPLSVVQPVGVLAVPIAVVLTAFRTHRRPSGGVLLGVAVCVAGVALFVGTAAGTAVSTPAPNGATLSAGVVVAGVVLLLATLGYARNGWMRCVACAMAGAVAFGLVSALVRAVSQTVTSGESEVLDPAVIAAVFGVVAAVVVGGWLVQQAFASGPPEVVVACLTVVDPIVAVLLGIFLLGEGAHTPTGTWLLLVFAGLVAAIGVLALARHHPDAAARRAENPSDASESRVLATLSSWRSDLIHRR